MFIITGGAGFIGSALVWKLNQLGHNDIIIVDNIHQSDKWKNLVNLKFVDFISKEYFKEYIDRMFDPWQGFEKCVIHLGACSSTTEKDGDYLMKNNFHYSRQLVQWALVTGTRFINASSASTYGDGSLGFDDEKPIDNLRPLNMYAYTKQLFDLWLQRQEVLDKVTSLKFFNVFGPNEYHKKTMLSVPLRAFNQIQNGNPVTLFKSNDPKIRDGFQSRDFIYIKDVLRVIMFFIDNPTINGIYNVGTGKARTFESLVVSVFKALYKDPEIEYIAMPTELSPNYQNYTCASMNKLHSVGFNTSTFYSLENAINEYVNHYLVKQDPYLK